MKTNRREFTKRVGLIAAASSFGFHSSVCGQSIGIDDYLQHDGLGLANLVKKGKVTAKELLNTAIARAKAVPPEINAIIDDPTLVERAQKQAILGEHKGKFGGVPFLVKDSGFPMQGIEMWRGSSLFQDWKPKEDSEIVRRLRRAGLNIFGRTTTPELGLFFTTESRLTGDTRNPWDTEYSVGGSSGGSAAAVAAGIVPMASGADGGGSIRVPASCCGLFGYKPTRELVPLGKEDYANIISVHVITRTVRDSAAMLDQTAHTELGSPIAPNAFDGSYLKALTGKPDRLKIGIVYESELALEISTVCKDAVSHTANKCEEVGHEVENVTNEYVKLFNWQELLNSQKNVFLAGMTLDIERRLSELGRELKTGDLEEAALGLFEQGKELKATELASARKRMHDAALVLGQFHQRFDVIMTPTLSRPPAKIGVLNPSGEGFDLQQAVEYGPFTFVANFTGQPAMSVPMYWTRDVKPLPVGVHFIGRYAEDAELLRLAAQLENAEPWKHKRPPV